MEKFRFDSYLSLLFDPILPGLTGVFFARKMHSTSEFAMAVLSKCVCVNHLKRCKTSHLGFLFNAFYKFAGGNRVAAWLSPTKLHAVDKDMGSVQLQVPAFSFYFLVMGSG